MRYFIFLVALLFVIEAQSAEEARILRFPHYHNGTLVFSYMGDLWTVKEDGSNPRRLTVSEGQELVPYFSPDGKTIAFSSNRHGNFDVYTMPAEGGEAKRLTVHSSSGFVVGWMPTGDSVLFVSDREPGYGSKLYTVSANGGQPVLLNIGTARRGTFSPDGKRMVFNPQGFITWRKRYRGSANTELWIVDPEKKTYRRLTDFDGQDAWPMWAGENEIYFASDRDGAMNIWKISPSGGDPLQVTKHPYPGIKYPSISWDKKTIVYEFDSGLWKLTVPQGIPQEIKLRLPTDLRENKTTWMTFANNMDDFSVDSAGKNAVFSIRGEIFNAPALGGDLIRLTNGEARDRKPAISPDGTKVAYISDKDGEEKIYLIDAKGGKEEKIEPSGNVHYNLMWTWGGILGWSPDGKKLAYGADSKVCVYDFSQKKTTAQIEGVRGTIVSLSWSPDGRWLAYSRRNQELNFDVYAVNTAEGLEYRITNDPCEDFSPAFAPDGKSLLWISNKEGSFQVYYLPLDKRTYDASDLEEIQAEMEKKRKEEEAKKAPEDPHGKTLDDIVITDLTETTKPEIIQKAQKPKEKSSAEKVTIDMEDIEQRVRKITNVKGDIGIGPIVPKESNRVILSVHEDRGNMSLDVVYSAAIDPTGDPGADFRELASAGSIRAMDLALDGDMLFMLEPGALTYMPSKGGPKKSIPYVARIEIDEKAERAQILGETWRALRDGFYDEKMHGFDWKKIGDDYRAMLDYVVDKDDLEYLINEMLGEINASHMGYYSRSTPPDAETEYLGMEIETDYASGLYRISYIYPEGPADKDFIEMNQGDYILEVDGAAIKAGDNLDEKLTNPLNRKVVLTVNNIPSKEGARKVRIPHINSSAQRSLWYEDWVRKNRKHVEEISGGCVGYLHIMAMDGQSLEQFKHDLKLNADKKALIIDVRYNGGGNIEQELLDILDRRRYQKWIPRDIGEEFRPHEGFFGPKAVLINSSSASNAEMFPAGFRKLGLGKVIGVPTTGAVIGTTGYSLIDGSMVRMPQVGVSLIDGTNMENLGVAPDIYVENTPDDEMKGVDAQLDAAVEELMKETEAQKPADNT